MVIIVALLLLLLPHVACKSRDVTCVLQEPLRLLRSYYQPGDFIIGGILFDTFIAVIPPVFSEYPHGSLDKVM